MPAGPGSAGASPAPPPLTQTLDAIAPPAVPTATLEAAGNVDAGGVHVAVVSPHLALVHIWTNANTGGFPEVQKAALRHERARRAYLCSPWSPCSQSSPAGSGR